MRGLDPNSNNGRTWLGQLIQRNVVCAWPAAGYKHVLCMHARDRSNCWTRQILMTTLIRGEHQTEIFLSLACNIFYSSSKIHHILKIRCKLIFNNREDTQQTPGMTLFLRNNRSHLVAAWGYRYASVVGLPTKADTIILFLSHDRMTSNDATGAFERDMSVFSEASDFVLVGIRYFVFLSRSILCYKHYSIIRDTSSK